MTLVDCSVFFAFLLVGFYREGDSAREKQGGSVETFPEGLFLSDLWGKVGA